MCNSPKKPTLNPAPKLGVDSSSYAIAGSDDLYLDSASRSVAISLESMGYTPD